LSAQLSTAEAEQALRRIETAIESLDYRATEVRRVRGPFSGYGRGGEWVGVIESILHRAGQTGANSDRFAIELRGIEGRTMGALELQQRQQLYRGQVDYLFRYQSFRVLDAHLAAQQYAIYALGDGGWRAGRRCNRVAVVSRTPDRPSWLLDLDAAKAFPLYAGQFAPTGNLVAELEVTNISFDQAAHLPPDDGWAWTPRQGVENFGTFDQAAQRASNVVALRVGSGDVGAGYVFQHARVITNPLSGEQSLIQVFTDGIDTLFVTQRQCPPLRSLGQTARSYVDAGVVQYSFQHATTDFLIVGRNSDLREVALRIYRRAVAEL